MKKLKTYGCKRLYVRNVSDVYYNAVCHGVSVLFSLFYGVCLKLRIGYQNVDCGLCTEFWINHVALPERRTCRCFWTISSVRQPWGKSYVSSQLTVLVGILDFFALYMYYFQTALPFSVTQAINNYYCCKSSHCATIEIYGCRCIGKTELIN